MKAARALIGAAALALASAPAAAQSSGSDSGTAAEIDISGSWAFETDVYERVCRMTGELEVRPGAEPGVYEGRLVAYEACSGREPYQAEQTSLVRRDGDQVKIESKLVRVLPSPEFYEPDDFVLTIVDGSLMVGELRSADIAPVRFRRRGALVS